jgi:hypothetical protein
MLWTCLPTHGNIYHSTDKTYSGSHQISMVRHSLASEPYTFSLQDVFCFQDHDQFWGEHTDCNYLLYWAEGLYISHHQDVVTHPEDKNSLTWSWLHTDFSTSFSTFWFLPRRVTFKACIPSLEIMCSTLKQTVTITTKHTWWSSTVWNSFWLKLEQACMPILGVQKNYFYCAQLQKT